MTDTLLQALLGLLIIALCGGLVSAAFGFVAFARHWREANARIEEVRRQVRETEARIANGARRGGERFKL